MSPSANATTWPRPCGWCTRYAFCGNPGGTVGFEFIDRYHPGATYLSVLSLTASPATTPVGPKKVFDLGYDVLTDFSLTLPGFAGAINASGRANASLLLPPLPWLVGLPVHAAMASLDPALPELVEEASPTATFVIQ